MRTKNSFKSDEGGSDEGSYGAVIKGAANETVLCV